MTNEKIKIDINRIEELQSHIEYQIRYLNDKIVELKERDLEKQFDKYELKNIHTDLFVLSSLLHTQIEIFMCYNENR